MTRFQSYLNDLRLITDEGNNPSHLPTGRISKRTRVFIYIIFKKFFLNVMTEALSRKEKTGTVASRSRPERREKGSEGSARVAERREAFAEGSGTLAERREAFKEGSGTLPDHREAFKEGSGTLPDGREAFAEGSVRFSRRSGKN
jgi:hypothetical protein